MKLVRIPIVDGRRLQPGEFALGPTLGADALLTMVCPNGKQECGVALVLGAPDEIKKIHGWDGNEEEPTITPSIGCDNAPRCGWHGSITAGDRNP